MSTARGKRIVKQMQKRKPKKAKKHAPSKQPSKKDWMRANALRMLGPAMFVNDNVRFH